jgi:UDP-sugar pyrophosphorylase
LQLPCLSSAASLQVVLIKQEKVPCLIDNDAHLALDPNDPYAVQTKPHGHGDVHGLLHRSGLAQQWQQQGLQWVCFFQVTLEAVNCCCVRSFWQWCVALRTV